MVPSTTAALIAFLAFVSPGLVFELLRQRVRPALQQSTFVEVSTVVLASLIFTSAAGGLTALLRLLRESWFVNPRQWLSGGWDYVVDHPGPLAVTAAVEFTLACLLALGAHSFLGTKAWPPIRKRLSKLAGSPATHQMSPHPVMWDILCGRLPKGTTARKVVLSLDGCVISAKLHGFDNETLVVASPISIRWTDSGITTDITDDLAQLMAIPLTQVSFAGVRYEKAPAHVRPGSEAST